MLQIIQDYNEVVSSNGVFLLKNKFDIEKLNFLKLDTKIISKIEKIILEQKNTVFKVFVSNEHFEELIFLFYLDVSEDIYVFLWKNISQLPEKITFEYQKDNVLLDSIILWKYEYNYYKEVKQELELHVYASELDMKYLWNRLLTLKNITDVRDLVNKPACDKTPDKYVQYIKNIKFKNTRVKIIDYDEIKRLWLNLIDAVGRASTSKPKLVILEKIVDKKKPTLWLVWKWVTFDTWGLNIKVEDYMYNMKDDMAWSATLLFTMKELDEQDLDFNIICALPIAENSIAWDAYRPGDIIKSYSWKTVEIINTDAEWRLILADAISYISKNYQLESITSVATLTWACMYALWYNYAGIMWDNRQMIDNALHNTTFEQYWELPFNDFYVSKTKWNISDFINYTSWIYVWATMWWAFLKNFCLNNEKFTHIDTAWVSFVKEKYGLYNSGATGFWVDSLSQIIMKYDINSSNT